MTRIEMITKHFWTVTVHMMMMICVDLCRHWLLQVWTRTVLQAGNGVNRCAKQFRKVVSIRKWYTSSPTIDVTGSPFYSQLLSKIWIFSTIKYIQIHAVLSDDFVDDIGTIWNDSTVCGKKWSNDDSFMVERWTVRRSRRKYILSLQDYSKVHRNQRWRLSMVK